MMCTPINSNPGGDFTQRTKDAKGWAKHKKVSEWGGGGKHNSSISVSSENQMEAEKSIRKTFQRQIRARNKKKCVFGFWLKRLADFFSWTIWSRWSTIAWPDLNVPGSRRRTSSRTPPPGSCSFWTSRFSSWRHNLILPWLSLVSNFSQLTPSVIKLK